MVSCVLIVRATLLFKLLCLFFPTFLLRTALNMSPDRRDMNELTFTPLKTLLYVSGSGYGIAEIVC
jgi:hypothetical protein